MKKSINELEAQIKLLDADFTIVPNENNEMAGIYWKDNFTGIALSKEGVKEMEDYNFADINGTPHRTEANILQRVEKFLEDIKEPAYMEIITDKGDEEVTGPVVTEVSEITPETLTSVPHDTSIEEVPEAPLEVITESAEIAPEVLEEATTFEATPESEPMEESWTERVAREESEKVEEVEAI